jgi:hypothetical protein
MYWLARVVNKIPVGLLWMWGIISTCLFFYVDAIYSEPPRSSQTVSAPPRLITLPPAHSAGAPLPSKPTTPAFDTSCYTGTWNEEPPNQNTWTFEMDRSQLHVVRSDGAIFGFFSASQRGDTLEGWLSTGETNKWNQVVLQAAEGCESIRTNLPWSFRQAGPQ